MLTYVLDASLQQPLYEQLSEAVKSDILAGHLKSGDKLPSKISLADHLGVSKITVENAYAQLLAEGYIYSRERSGYYVEDIQVAGFSASLDANPAFSGASAGVFIPEIPSEASEENRSASSAAAELFPFSVWSRLMRGVILDSGPDILAPGPGQGLRQLREAIAKDLFKRRGMSVDPGQIFIGAGSEYFYNMLVQFFGRTRKYALENPGHRKIGFVYEANDAEIVPLKLDQGGVIPGELEKSEAEIAHITPFNHFPTGAVMPIGRRQQIMSWLVAGENRYIIEDDYDSEFRFSGRPIPSMQSMDTSGRIIYINTFSRTIAPAIRISYMILPAGLVEPWRTKMGFYNCTVPSFEQLTLTKFIEGGYFERHINRLKKHYSGLLESLKSVVLRPEFAEYCKIINAGSGLNFILEFKDIPADSNLRSLLNLYLPQASLIEDYCIAPDARYDNCAVVDYTGLSPEKFGEGLALLVTTIYAK